jgi:hypothetical protein
MNIIEQLRGVGSVEQGLAILLQSPNALDYSREELLKGYVEGVSEMKALALTLCGTANQQLAITVMSFNSNPLEFFNNVSYNGYNSIPLVVRVLNIALCIEYERTMVNESMQSHIED